MSECGKFAVFHKTEQFYLALPCNKWSCPVCNKKLANDLSTRLKQSSVNEWKIKTHLTLTVSGEYESLIINESFNDLLTYIHRGGNFSFVTYYGNIKTVTLPPRPSLRYIRVNEIQPERLLSSGKVVMHIHLVANQYLTKYDIIPIWNHVLKLHGSQADFNYVEDTHPHNFNAGKYLLKYFTKAEHQELFDKGTRRYGGSRGLIPPKPVRISSGNFEFMSLRKAVLVLAWYQSDSPREKERIAYDLGFDSRYDNSIIHKIAYGY